MSRPQEVEVAEPELEGLLVKNPEAIEEGMRILGRQIRTDTGPLDILAVDEEGNLTVIELKNEEDEGQLDQGLRYYDWANANIDAIARFFSDKVDPRNRPRLILIAPSFPDTIKKIAKYVEVNLELKEYHVFQLVEGDKFVFCKSIEVGYPREPPSITPIPEKLKIIETEEVKKVCIDAIQELTNIKAEVRPIADEWMSVWYNGKRFMYLGCKKQFFVCQVQMPDGTWGERIRILSNEDWRNYMIQTIDPILKSLEH